MKFKRDGKKMGTAAHENANGFCEWCGKPLLLGTPAAHLIPKDQNDHSLDEPWNTALLCLFGNLCHRIFDLNRAKAVRKMRADGNMKIPDRIDAHPRLTDYFDKKESRQAYLDSLEGR